MRFTGIAWPPISNLIYTRRSSFQPNAFQEKVHVEVVDRFTVCFFSLSTSVRRSDFSFNSLRLDAVSSKTTTSTFPSTLRFRTVYFYIRIGRPVEHHQTTLTEKRLPEKRKTQYKIGFVVQAAMHIHLNLVIPATFFHPTALSDTPEPRLTFKLTIRVNIFPFTNRWDDLEDGNEGG